MPDVGERLEKVEQGLTELSRHMDKRFTEVDQRFDRVEGRIDSLAADVQKLRVLGERSEERIKLVAEVQGHHGETLQRLNDAVEPLKALQPVFEKVVKDHEERIAALERARR